MTEEEFCRYIRERWGDGYADFLEERVEAAVELSEEQWVRIHWEETWGGWSC
jgi:hypothetical protein